MERTQHIVSATRLNTQNIYWAKSFNKEASIDKICSYPAIHSTHISLLTSISSVPLTLFPVAPAQFVAMAAPPLAFTAALVAKHPVHTTTMAAGVRLGTFVDALTLAGGCDGEAHAWWAAGNGRTHIRNQYPDSKVHGANMGPIWGRQDPDGAHVGPMNLAIWVYQLKLTS